ncbi:MAG: trimethylamine methyltransferase [Gammaproteobacteria bacterium]|nr:trimethylamine methyltransferase [Gammaproteobacteria bacterium]
MAQAKQPRRNARRAQRTQFNIKALPAIERGNPAYELLDEEALDRIHVATLDILRDPGIEFRDDEAAAIWKEAGADVSGHRIRIDPDLLMSLIAKAPEAFTLHARNPERSVRIGGRNQVFAPSNGSPFVLDLEGQRRNGTLADFNDFCKLAYLSLGLHVTGGVACEPMDIPVPNRHLHTGLGHLTMSDKPYMGATTSKQAAEDSVNMARIAMPDRLANDETVMISIINGNSPLVWDETMLDALKVYARANQAALVTPFILAGASTPLSLIGAITQMNAEALAGIAFAQLVSPGCPMVYGQAAFTVSMLTGAPVVRTSEISHMQFIAGQLARRYKLPWRTSGAMSGSKVFDAQAGYEASLAFQASMLSGANFIWHSAGWLEGGLSVSFAKFVLDAEQCEIMQRYAAPPCFDDLDKVIDVIREIGPGGHFLGTDHTRANFETAFAMPKLFDSNSFEQWESEGAKDTNKRAIESARDLLQHYARPPINESTEEELRAYVRKMEESQL